MSRVEVISGIERRRRWSIEQKRAIVEASLEAGACVSAVARRCDVHPNQIYRWRRALIERRPGFAEVMVVGSDPTAPAEMVAMVEIEISGKMHLRLPPTTPPALAAAIIRALGEQ